MSSVQNSQPPVNQTHAAGSSQPFPNTGVDPLVLAIYLLMQASDEANQSALIHAKGLDANASAQQRLNAEMAGLQNQSLPSNKAHRTVIATHWEYTKAGKAPSWAPPSWVPHHWVNKKVWATKYPNQGKFEAAQAHNQVISGQRAVLADQLIVLQQDAQIGETGVNSITDQSMQSIQEQSTLQQMLMSMTYLALLRSPPPGA